MEYEVGRRTNRPLAIMLALCGALAIITLVSAGRAQEGDNVRGAARQRVAQDLRAFAPATPLYADTAWASPLSAHPDPLPPEVNPHEHSLHGRQVTKVVPLPPDLLPLPGVEVTPDLSRQTAEQAMAKSYGCIACHQGVVDMHNNLDTVRLGCVDCHGGDPCARREKQGTRAAAFSGGLGDFRQSRPHLHALEPRIAGVHSLREPRRPARGAYQLRRLPSAGSAARQEEHDDARRHAVGRRTLQQRLGADQEPALRRKLQHGRRVAAAANRAAADGRRNGLQGGGAVSRSVATVRDIAARQRAAHL